MENNQQMFDREFLNMFILHLLLLRSVAHTHSAVARTAPAILQRYSTVALLPAYRVNFFAIKNVSCSWLLFSSYTFISFCFFFSYCLFFLFFRLLLLLTPFTPFTPFTPSDTQRLRRAIQHTTCNSNTRATHMCGHTAASAAKVARFYLKSTNPLPSCVTQRNATAEQV